MSSKTSLATVFGYPAFKNEWTRLTTRLKNKLSKAQVRDELSFWGVYGTMSGLHSYKKEDGSWDLGFYPSFHIEKE